jgi:Tfp pilus assembly protein PilO
MIRLNQQSKLYIRVALGVLVALDLILIVLAWRASSTTPESQHAREAGLQAEDRLLAADVRRAEVIRTHLAQVGKQSDDFYNKELPAGRTGYAVIVEDLGDIAGKAGLRTSVVGYRQKEIKDRGVTEVQVTAAVEGDYNGLIKLINGLERSPNFYVLENLALSAGSSGNDLKLSLSLRTYFRS